MANVNPNQLTKIGVFYDGSYFSMVSSYYMYHSERKARISLSGLQKFIRQRVAQEESIDEKYCQIVDTHYFRGRFSANQLQESQILKEKIWDDALIKSGVTTHYLPMGPEGSEKGVDVWLALECFELSIYKQFSVVVLVAGDSDYIPLVRKLNGLGVRVMVLGWTYSYQAENGEMKGSRASHVLLNEATYPLKMDQLINGYEGQSEEERVEVSNIFIRKRQAEVVDLVEVEAEPVVEAQPEEPEDNGEPWLDGTIINIKDGFGFIKPLTGGDNLFFHHTALTNAEFSELFKGMEVSFKMGEGRNGPAAVAVRTYY
ncbi:MAG TPA: NYN domain-containing protein [Anaerovoracaceae bacterium]|nr:NYN domain-containing protein [Anaerovoracaceae bacterium]